MQNDLHVTVHYIAASKPYQDGDADRNETVGQLKNKVLTAFGLTEGNQPDGMIHTYTLYFQKQPLESLSQTLGEIADHAHALALRLNQQITQGDAVGVSELNLQDDFQEALSCDEAHRWKLEKPTPLEVLATMSPASTPADVYQARLLWHVYPEEPPSLKFRNLVTGSLMDPTAWPQIRGFRPTSLDACVNWCTEGFALHPEWRSDPRFRWDPRGNVLLKVLRILQEEFDEHYAGRCNG